jgi:hypothetical protein
MVNNEAVFLGLVFQRRMRDVDYVPLTRTFFTLTLTLTVTVTVTVTYA